MTTLKYLGDNCFANVTHLAKIENLPNTIEYIGDKGFNWC
jgi:hypothetical protein